MKELIEFWGSIASLIALALVVLGYVRKKVVDVKVKKKEMEQKYVEVKSKITKLMNQATTYQKRQDLYVYINSVIHYGRHNEIRWILITAALGIVLFILLIVASGLSIHVFNAFETLSEAKKHWIIFWGCYNALVFVFMVYYFSKLIILVKEMGKLNQSYTDSFIDGYYEHIQKSFEEIERV